MKDEDTKFVSKWANLSKKSAKTATSPPKQQQSPYAKLADVSGYGVSPYEGDVIEHLKE